jgi:hypothetical protein
MINDEELEYNRQTTALRSNTIESTTRSGRVTLQIFGEVLNTDLHLLSIGCQNRPWGPRMSTEILLSDHQQLSKLSSKADQCG